ncbi:hypothetical protein AAD018_007790 [Aestuariibius insulae]|uniref:hypothetical protein n=1 Tax=Aestuariibius insulae TaxID=2058287 RepID=UPI00345EB922
MKPLFNWSLRDVSDTQDPPVMLVIGDMNRWRRDGRRLPEASGIHFVGFQALDEACLEEKQPDIVLSGLLGPGFDVIDVATKLEMFEFTGRYRALCDDVPSVDIIVTEVRQQVPGIDFDILVLNDDLRVREQA